MGGKITVFDRAARMNFLLALRDWRAGYIQGSKSRLLLIIFQNIPSPEMIGRGGVVGGNEGSFVRDVW